MQAREEQSPSKRRAPVARRPSQNQPIESSRREGEEAEDDDEITLQIPQSQSQLDLQRKIKGKAPVREEEVQTAGEEMGNKVVIKKFTKEQLKERDKQGNLFSNSEINQIESMSENESEIKRLKEVGINTYKEADEYLIKNNYKDWLNIPPGQRLLIKSLAVNREDQKNRETPSPAYTQALSQQLKTDGTLSADQKKDKEQKRDEYIRNAFVKTLAERELTPDSKNNEKLKNMTDVELRKIQDDSAKASEILEKIFLILQSGLKIYDEQEKAHIDYKQGDVAKALAHGGRVNIRIPQLKKGEKKTDLTDWIGITEGQSSDPAHPVKSRWFATHHMKITKNQGENKGKFEEQDGTVNANLKNTLNLGIKLYGLNLSAGGLGKKDCNGDIILPDGSHGHMFIGFTPPTQKKDGALQIGLETTAPGFDSTTGYKHNMFSTEATSNPESSFHGHKRDKIGEGLLKNNQRYVDLDSYPKEMSQKTWLTYLKDVEKDWKEYLKENGSNSYKVLVDNTLKDNASYKELVGKRKYFGYKDNENLDKIS